MTYTVDPEALRAVARRFDAEAREIRAAAARVTEPDAGPMSALVDLVLTDLTGSAHQVASAIASTATNLRFHADLSEKVDHTVADGIPELVIRP